MPGVCVQYVRAGFPWFKIVDLRGRAVNGERVGQKRKDAAARRKLSERDPLPLPEPTAPDNGHHCCDMRKLSHFLRGCLSCLAVLAATSGCASSLDGAGYYWQSIKGHLQLMQAARPIDDWLADPSTSAALRARLLLAQRIRSYASRVLKLPDNASYRRYADLHRAAAVWNVVAAPHFSLDLHTSCFPVTGCVGYRGYYAKADAEAEAAALRKQDDLETAVYAVPAYSTLGWFNWLGGDPLLNTFIGYPDGALAGLIFHELAHQVVYAKGDTTFNESYATAVQDIGRDRWLASEATPQAREDFARFARRQDDFRTLIRETRDRLDAIYQQKPAKDIATRAQVAMKEEAMETFRTSYSRLRASWGAPDASLRGYDAWVASANNASFGAQAAYDTLVPSFRALFDRIGRQHPADPWPPFYAEVKRLAALSRAERRAELGSFPSQSIGPSPQEGEGRLTPANR
jgi:predicted aminopeptidase